VGADVRRFRPGDDVYFCGAAGRPGTFAERAASDERIVGRKPQHLSFEEAASVPLVALTAWEAILEGLGAPEGREGARTLLVLGGAGGVGSMAVQVARRVCGLRVVATASRPESAAFCRERGADLVVDHSRDLAAQLRDADVRGLDYVLSCAPDPDFRVLGALLNPFGRICCILPLVGADLTPLFPKRGTVAFENVSARAEFDVEPERQGRILDRVAGLLDERVLVPSVTEVLPWTAFRAAFERIESGHTVGKIVLKVGS
jgi:NADPH:quinone reductase-like Zn-dependent oxidoreductase